MSVSLHQNGTSIARQISGLEGFERLRADQPQDRNGKKWTTQLQGFCQKVSDLYDRIAEGELVQKDLLQRVGKRIDQIASKNCAKEDRRMITAAKTAAQRMISGDVYFQLISRSNELQEPVVPNFKRGLVSFFMQMLYFQGIMGWRTDRRVQFSQPSAMSPFSFEESRIAKSNQFNRSQILERPIALSTPMENNSRIIPAPASGKQKETASFFESLGNIYNYFFPSIRHPNCLAFDCPDLDESSLHPREKEAIDSFWGFATVGDRLRGFKAKQEWLRFQKDDPRNKMLFVSSYSDWNGAFAPWISATIMKHFNENHDPKYTVFTSYEDMCREIQEGAKVGKLAYLMIGAHGDRHKMWVLDGHDAIFERVITSPDIFSLDYLFSTPLSQCFSGIDITGKIILNSCSTGKPSSKYECYTEKPSWEDPYDNIAQVLADAAKRPVIAPNNPVNLGSIVSTQPFMIYHRTIHYKCNSDGSFAHTPDGRLITERYSEPNMYRTFYPRYSLCQSVTQSSMHPVEQLAIDAVKADLIAKTILPDSASFLDLQDYLRFCKEDPKKKFLYLLSKDYGKDSAKYLGEFLVHIADKFDVNLKAIDRTADICQWVDEAINQGEVAAVLIHATGEPNKLNLLESLPFSHWIHSFFSGSAIFPGCLSRIPSTAQIILVGGQTGSSQNGSNKDNLAYKIADMTKRVVYAPTQLVYPNKLTLRSWEPIEIHHPSVHYLIPDTDGNIFKKFSPEN